MMRGSLVTLCNIEQNYSAHFIISPAVLLGGQASTNLERLSRVTQTYTIIPG